MTEEREFEGKDLEEALDEAAKALRIPQEELHYDMLDAGRRGLLGLGVKNVRIRVKPPIDAEFPPEEPEVEPQPERPSKPEASEAEPPKQARPKRKAPAKRKPRNSKKKTTSRNAPRRGARRSPAEKKPSQPADPAVVESVEKMVASMVAGMGLDLEVEASARDGGVTLRLGGVDEETLIDKNSELLSAIQLLLNRMSRRTWPGLGRIDVDCNGHAKPRDEELVAMARNLANEVTESGKTRRLHPMNAYERRIVHLTVREFPGLTSNSDGDGALKRVRISKVRNEI